MIQGTGNISQEIAVRLNADASGMQQEATKIEKAFNVAIRAASKAMIVFGQVTDAMARMKVRMGQAAAGVFAFGFYQAAQFESAFMDVRKTVDATESQFKSLGNSLRAMSTTMPTSVAQLSKLAAIAGQLGVAVPSIEKYTKVAAQLGDATEMSAEGAITALAQFMTVTNTAAASVENIASALVQLGNVSNATEQQILNFSQNIAGTASAMGFAATDILAVGTAFSEVGIEAEAGATAVQRVLIDMNMAVQNGGDQLIKYSSLLGMTTDQFKAMWAANPSKVLDQFTESLKRAGSNAPKVLKSLGIDDVRLIRAFTNLANSSADIGTRMEDAAMAAEDNVALAEEAEKRYKSFYAVLQKIRNSFADIAQMISGQWLGPVTKILDMFATMLNTVTKLPGPFKEILGIFLQIRAVMMMTRGARAAFGLRMPMADMTLGALTSQAGRGFFRGMGQQARGRTMETAGRSLPYRAAYQVGRVPGAVGGMLMGRGIGSQISALRSSGEFIPRQMARLSSAKGAFSEAYGKAKEKYLSPEAAEAKEHTSLFSKMLAKLTGIERAIREQTTKANEPGKPTAAPGAAGEVAAQARLADSIDELGDDQAKASKTQAEATKRAADDTKAANTTMAASISKSTREQEKSGKAAAEAASKSSKVAGGAAKVGGALGSAAGMAMGMMPMAMILMPLIMGLVGTFIDRRAKETEKRVKSFSMNQAVETASQEAGISFKPWTQQSLYQSGATAGPSDLSTVVGTPQWQEKWRHVIEPTMGMGESSQAKGAFFQEMVMQMTIQKGGNLTGEDLQELYKVIDYVFKGDPEAAYTLKMELHAVGLEDALDISERVERVSQMFKGIVVDANNYGSAWQDAARAAADIAALQIQTGNVLGGVASTAAAFEGVQAELTELFPDQSGAGNQAQDYATANLEQYVRRLQADTQNQQGENTLVLDNAWYGGGDSEESFKNFITNVYNNQDKAGATTNRAIVDALNHAYGSEEAVLEGIEEGKITAEDLARVAEEQEQAQAKVTQEYYKQTQFASELSEYNMTNLNLAQRQTVAYGAMMRSLIRTGDYLGNYTALQKAWQDALAAGDTEAAEELKALMDQAGALVAQKWTMEFQLDLIGKTPAQIEQEFTQAYQRIENLVATQVITPELGQQIEQDLTSQYFQQQQAAAGQAQQIAQALVNADRQRAEVNRSAARSRQKAAEEHQKQLKKMQEGLAESYEKIDKEEQKAIKKSKENLTAWGNAYERLALKPVSSLRAVVTTMGRQVEKFGEMQANLAQLQQMGLQNPRLLQYLGFDNPENYAQVERFLADAMANPDLISQLNQEWQDKFDLTQAFTDTSGIVDLIKEDMDEARKETKEQYDKSVKEINEQYNDQLKDMAEAVAEQHRQINLQLTQMAEDMTRTFEEQMALVLNSPLFQQVGIEIANLIDQGMILAQVLGGAYASPGSQTTTTASGQQVTTGSGVSNTQYYQAMPNQAPAGWWDAVWISNMINGSNEFLPEGFKPSDNAKNKALYLHNKGREEKGGSHEKLAAEGYPNHTTTPKRAAKLRAAGLNNEQMNQGHLAVGGVVTGATNALVGEAGPEAVIPLNSRGAAFMQAVMGGGMGGGQMNLNWKLQKEGDGQVAADMREELDLVVPVIQKFSKELQEEYSQDHEAFKKRNDENAEDLAKHLQVVGKVTAKAFSDGIKAGLDTAWLDKWLVDITKKLDGLVTQLETIKQKHIDISTAYSWWAFLGFKTEAEAKKAGKGIDDAKKSGWFNYGTTDMSGPGVTGPSSGLVGGVTITSNVPSSGAHHKRDDFSEPWGDPRGNEKAWGATHLVNIKHPGGSMPVHKISASRFAGFLTDLYATGYKPKDMYAWSVRRIAGSQRWSEHAWANAIDIDATQNAGDRAVAGKTNSRQYGIFNPNVVGPLARKWDLTWGGLWDYSDPMHFEYTKGARWAASSAAAQGAITTGRVDRLITGESGREMILPLNARGMGFLLDVANSVRTQRQAQDTGGGQSTSHVNQFGPVTVVSNDPGEMARKLESKARQRKLTRPAGVSVL